MARLEKQINDWVSNNLISRDQAEGIRQFEAKSPGSSWVLYSFLILGATISGIGVISLIASNWDTIPDAVKLGADFLLLIGLTVGIHHAWRQKKFIQYEVLLVSFLFLCLASIGLISQIYHTGGKLYQALMLWSLITAGIPIISQKTFGPFLWVSGFIIALICTVSTAPLLEPLYKYNNAAVYMAVPLLSAVLAMLSKKVFGEIGLTRAFIGWILIGTIMALVVSEIGFYGYRHLDFAKAGFPAYLPGYILGVIAALGVWFSSGSTRPQKILLIVFLVFYFLPFHLRYMIKDPGNILAFCTIINLSLLAIFLASLKQRKLFQFLLFMVGVRFLILYFQAFGGLAMTGFGLIMSGVLIISMVVYWNKYRVQFGHVVGRTFKMNRSRITVITALLVPIIALGILTGYKHYKVTVGTEVILPIEGYDPRDLLSGHYLTYRVNYGAKNICEQSKSNQYTGYVCLEPKHFTYFKPESCQIMIKGTCNGTRFKAGIERFYIPEDQAVKLDKDVRSKKGSIVLSVTPDGHAQIKDLLIDGKPWNAK